jgi:hypothetical protein
MAEQALRGQYIEILMQQLKSCRYPSVSMMNRVEQAIRDRSDANAYVELLIEVLGRDQYPSPALLDRVRGLIGTLEP